MCLAVPGQVVRWLRRDVPFCEAEVDFLGVRRVCNLSCVPEVEVGQYVIVHAGVAISSLQAEAAAKWRQDLQSLGPDTETDEPRWEADEPRWEADPA